MMWAILHILIKLMVVSFGLLLFMLLWLLVRVIFAVRKQHNQFVQINHATRVCTVCDQIQIYTKEPNKKRGWIEFRPIHQPNCSCHGYTINAIREN